MAQIAGRSEPAARAVQSTHHQHGPRAFAFHYDVSPDGQRFLLITTPQVEATSAPITVVLNWQAGLKK